MRSSVAFVQLPDKLQEAVREYTHIRKEMSLVPSNVIMCQIETEENYGRCLIKDQNIVGIFEEKNEEVSWIFISTYEIELMHELMHSEDMFK